MSNATGKGRSSRGAAGPSGTTRSTPVPEELPPARRDWGRIGVIVLVSWVILGRFVRVWMLMAKPPEPSRLVLELGLEALTMAFSVLVLVAYLRRGPARATDRNLLVWIAAPVATCLPLVIPALPQLPAGGLNLVLAFLLMLAGTAWSVWSVQHLATNLSVVPQARRLVDTGPYRYVRHPLYLGEIVTTMGFAVRAGHPSHVLVVIALIALQLYRAVREEALLAKQVPGYRAYAGRTWRIVPGVI